MSPVAIADLYAEHLRESAVLGTSQPRLSWQVQTDAPNWLQAAYEMECAHPDGVLRGSTGRVESGQSVLVAWPFDPLSSRERVDIRVRVWGQDGSESVWSDALILETGLLKVDDWSARFITPDWDEDTRMPNPSPYLRHEFDVCAGVRSARLYITALGLYEAQINGVVVGDHVLAPGWTVYDQHLRYQTFDVTGLVHEGRNAIGALLGEGWYRGRLGFGGGWRNIWGERLGLLAQLEIVYADGTSERIVSDANWHAATGAILTSGIYDGEIFDARLEPTGWSLPGYDDASWKGVRPLEWALSTLRSPVSPAVRRIEQIAPVSITQSPSGKTLVDFGQNLVGWLRIRVRGTAGQTVILRHAEVLEKGELGTRPLRRAEATDRYTLRGGDVETWEPRFTFHGFRYVEVTGWPGDLEPANLCAVVVHSDMRRTGWFECSNPLLNQLHENVVWGMRGNFVDVPTDCPQRDERLGWTGDLQVFSPTASFLYDVSGSLQSWLMDLAHEQRKLKGSVPHVVPNILGDGAGAAAWGDAAAVVPSVLYQRFGDAGILADQFESMCAWVNHLASVASANRLWEKGFQFGDWLDPTAPPDKPGQARTHKAIVATAYFARSAELVARAAAILGRDADRQHYQSLAAEVRAAFAREFVTPSGRVTSDAETAYALALVFDLLPTPEQRKRAGERLAELVLESGYHIRTGFVGTPLICDALCQTGHYTAAYRLLLQQSCPSWLYPVTMGATTIWERWDSMLPDGSINPGEMTSFNHYALGAVADWMHRFIGGIAPDDAGYRRIAIRPYPSGGLTSAVARHDTPYGKVECRWTLQSGQFEMTVTIPPNTRAQVIVPGRESDLIEVGSGTWEWSTPFDPHYRATFTVDDFVGDIMSNPATFATVMKTLAQLEAPSLVFGIMDAERGEPLRHILGLAGDGAERLTQAVAAALATGAP